MSAPIRLKGYDSMSCRLYRSHPQAAFVLLNSTLSKSPKGILQSLKMADVSPGYYSERAQTVWTELNQIAEENNAPCSFTTFPAHEWSASPKPTIFTETSSFE